jgi:F0F1-type ATP synthase membrane subunit b/b'
MDMIKEPEFWVAVAFVLFVGVLIYVGVHKKLIEALDHRSSRIQAELDEARRLRDEAGKLLAEYQRKQREAQRITEDLQADVERDRNDILQRAAQRMGEVVKKMADEKGLDLVVDTTNAVFFKPALEITEEAIAAYDKTFPAK